MNNELIDNEELFDYIGFRLVCPLDHIVYNYDVFKTYIPFEEVSVDKFADEFIDFLDKTNEKVRIVSSEQIKHARDPLIKKFRNEIENAISDYGKIDMNRFNKWRNIN